jgi:hypothetical protein
MRLRSILVLLAPLLITLGSASAGEFATRVSMQEKSAATFYVPAYIQGAGATELMVDTGSGYVLTALKRQGSARYVKDLQGILADGSKLVVPVYALASIKIGSNCWLHDIEAAVFPGTSRQILGLSALRKAAPFIFSVDPPSLALSHCAAPPKVSGQRPVGEVLTATQ